MSTFNQKIREIQEQNRIYSESSFVQVAVEEIAQQLRDLGVVKATVVPPRTETYRDKQGIIRKNNKQIAMTLADNSVFYLDLDSPGQRICLNTVIALDDLQWITLKSDKYNIEKSYVHIK